MKKIYILNEIIGSKLEIIRAYESREVGDAASLAWNLATLDAIDKGLVAHRGLSVLIEADLVTDKESKNTFNS